MGAGMQIKKLGDVCDFINRGISPKYIEKNGLIVINQKCIRDHKINFDLARFHDCKSKKVSEEKLIQIGDGLVNSTGTGTLGRVALVKELPVQATVDSHVTILRPIRGIFDENFFGYCLVSIEKEIEKLGDGCGGQIELSRNTLKNDVKISYPENKDDQLRIVKILDSAFESINKARAAAERNLNNVDSLFNSYLASILISPKDSWKRKTLKEVADVFGRGKSKHRPRNDKRLFDGQYPFIQTGDVRNSSHIIDKYTQTYNDVGMAQSKLWPKGTVCITIAANIAETGILGFEACFPDSIIGIVPNPNETNSDFIEYLLQSFRSVIQAKGKGAAQKNINLATFENELFQFPSVKEQGAIVEKLNYLSKETKKVKTIYQKKMAALDELKKSILNKAFSGEL